MPTAAVIGAGPVGCLAALGLAQRGYVVTLYEARPEDAFSGVNLQTNARSINLAISTRGLTALSFVDEAITKEILSSSVPMKARMIHSKASSKQRGTSSKAGLRFNDGAEGVTLESQAYSDKGENINSVSRNLLNRILLDKVLEKGVEIRWSHRLMRADVKAGEGQKVASSSASSVEEDQIKLTFQDANNTSVTQITNLIIGCDGHHSKVRDELSRASELDFSQHYIDNYYTELHVPVNKDGDFALDPNHLHIWPRHEYMLIALANQDKTFTSTLFAPRHIYDDYLNDQDELIRFFQEEFPDALEMIGRDQLIKDLLSRKPSSLATIECNPYHYQGKLIYLGDAAHAMVPFYGQGLNCGLEDVRIMLGLLDKHTKGVEKKDSQTSLAREKAFQEYTTQRHPDLLAISQLAMNNFHEMSSKVVSTPYRLRKQLDSLLVRILPTGWWDSQYSRITFSNMRYHEALDRENQQKSILNMIGLSATIGLTATTFAIGYRFFKQLNQ